MSLLLLNDISCDIQAEKKKYENCVGKFEEANPPKRFRVQDEYRKLQNSQQN